jgi:GGDEF domain-containing protein
MRSIDERRCLEEQLFTAAMTDPLTGLTNRQAFIAMLQHLVDQRIDGCLAVFDIDHFRAINMQYGQFAGDDVLVVFAELVRDMMRKQEFWTAGSGRPVDNRQRRHRADRQLARRYDQAGRNGPVPGQGQGPQPA